VNYSNLSKIRPKLRTQGNITGNFGRPKSKAGSPLNGLGVTKAEVVKCATQDEYLARLWYAFDNTDDDKLRLFLHQEIRKIHIQRGTW
jgi:hypothetical protein